ncbi:MAG: epoxyqueuosine reductase [Peptococcaceae bacterium]|nr:epoxyqueuosine reductase [Peptococcaceae bacterium]
MEFDFLVSQISQFVNTSPLNRADEIGLEKIFDQPLVGIAGANDPLFERLRSPEVIGPRHFLPAEYLPEAKTVVSYFLPYSLEVRSANSEYGLPALKWVYGRIEGEAVNNALRAYIVNLFQQNGINAVAPGLDSRFSVVDRRSNWSERHIAYIAGLGTFGLSKGLITKKGCAGRIGSVVTGAVMEPTARDYSGIYDYCTMCGECIQRCPSGAITQEGKNIPTCADYIDTVVLPRFNPRYGCGKCQTAVPCEFELP